MKKIALSVICLIALVFAINFTSALICKGEDGYYRDCSSLSNNNQYYDRTSTIHISLNDVKIESIQKLTPSCLNKVNQIKGKCYEEVISVCGKVLRETSCLNKVQQLKGKCYEEVVGKCGKQLKEVSCFSKVQQVRSTPCYNQIQQVRDYSCYNKVIQIKGANCFNGINQIRGNCYSEKESLCGNKVVLK